MSEKDIVGPFNEPMGMDTCKDLRLRAVVIPPLAEAEGFPDRVSMDTIGHLEYATRLDSPLEPACARCGARPVIARCVADDCNRTPLCIRHVGNMAQVNNNEWAACPDHVEQVAAMQRHCWRQQAANAGSVPEGQRA